MKIFITLAMILGLASQSYAAKTICSLSAQSGNGHYGQQIAQGVLNQELGSQVVLLEGADVAYMVYRDSTIKGQYGLAIVNKKDLTSVTSIHEGGTAGILLDSARKMSLVCTDIK